MIVLGVLLAVSVVANIVLWVVLRCTLDEAHEMFGELDGCRQANVATRSTFADLPSFEEVLDQAMRHVRQEDTAHGAPFDDHPEWNTMRST